MKQFSLTDDLFTNIQSVDEQHRELFDRLNRLLFAVSDNPAEIPAFLDYLQSYIEEHFHLEEELMRKHKYDDIESHRALHQGFKSTVNEIVQRYRSEEMSNETLVKHLEMEVGLWLVKHISKIDRKMTGWIIERSEI